MVSLGFLAAVALCAVVRDSGAAVLTYDGDKGQGNRAPKLATTQSCSKPAAAKPSLLKVLAASSTCDTKALLNEIPALLEKVIENKLKEKAADPAQQCFFTSDDLFAVGLDKYTEAKSLIGGKKTKVCLWSGLTTENAIKYVDEDSECLRLENTPFGNYMETKFNKKEGTNNYPKNALCCHKDTNWDKGVIKWPGPRFEEMHFLRALWLFASRGIATNIANDLTVMLNAAGNWKNNLSGDIFGCLEFPIVVMHGKIKTVTMRLVTDTKDVDENKKPKPVKFTCDSAEVKAFKTAAAADLGIKETDIKCETKTI